MKTTGQETPSGHIVGYGTFFAIWALLLALTAALVSTSHFLPRCSVPAMLIITPLKAGLVFYYFMHLKFENTLLKSMVFVALATLVVFIGLLFTDISFR